MRADRFPAGWYAIALADEVGPRKLKSVRRFGDDLVLFRGPDGTVAALEDRCPHRSVRLRGGSVSAEGCVQCPYHGFKFDVDGRCTHIPAQPDGPIPKTLTARAFPARERDGIVYLWHGEQPATLPEPPRVHDFTEASGFTHSFWMEHWATRMERAVENQLDIAHLPFVHRTTIGGSMPQALVTEAEALVVEGNEVGLRAGSGGRTLLHLYYPNVWVNLIGDDARVTAFFAPVDGESTDVYLSFAHRFVRPGVLAKLVAWSGARFSTRVTAQDRAIVEDHVENDPRHEALVQLDVPIARFRRWMASQRDAPGDDGNVVYLQKGTDSRSALDDV